MYECMNWIKNIPIDIDRILYLYLYVIIRFGLFFLPFCLTVNIKMK